MKKIGIIVFIIALAVGVVIASVFSFSRAAGNLFSFNIGFGGVKGSGNVQTEKRTVDNFKSVEVGGVFVVEITAQKDFSVEVEADDNLLPLIKTESNGETLKIETEQRFSSKRSIKVRISAPDVENLHISGASKISVTNLNNESFGVDSSGASKIKVEGATKIFKVDMSGASKLEAENFNAENVSVDASGASFATVSVLEDLKVDLSGASKLVYYGNPVNLEKRTSGASSVVGK